MKRSIPFPLLLIICLWVTALPAQEICWKQADRIISAIHPPSFPDKEYNVLDYGAVGDGKYDCTEAFRKAIDECSLKGGGKVVVPAGRYYTGSIHLKSNTNLFLSEKSVIVFSTDPQKYLPVVFSRWEGVECMNYSPLIYAYEQENIAVTGKGILEGQGSTDKGGWWNWKGNKASGWKENMPDQNAGRKMLFEMAEKNVPPEERIMGEGFYLRPNFIQPYRCKNVLIEGVVFRNSPMWFIHPVLSENIIIKNVSVEGLGPNNDGCNPESSKNILIENCYFNTGDDCIAIKSGRNNDGRRINVPSENIVIRNCIMREGHGGVVIGSEISGGVKNVFAEGCEMSSPNLERALRIKTNAVRGGVIENVFMRNVKVGEVSEAVLKIDFYYEEAEKGSYKPVVRNIFMENVKSQKSRFAIWIKAFEDSPAENIKITVCDFSNVSEGNFLQNVKDLELDHVIVNGKNITAD